MAKQHCCIHPMILHFNDCTCYTAWIIVHSPQPTINRTIKDLALTIVACRVRSCIRVSKSAILFHALDSWSLIVLSSSTVVVGLGAACTGTGTAASFLFGGVGSRRFRSGPCIEDRWQYKLLQYYNISIWSWMHRHCPLTRIWWHSRMEVVFACKLSSHRTEIS